MVLFNNIYKDKKVLITGDTGFKGSWLSIWLLELGAEVFGYALKPKTPKDNYVTASLKDKILHKDGDIRDYNELNAFFNYVQPDFAFHLAAQPLVIESYANPKYTFETNVMGTVNFFEAVRNTKTVKSAINITSDKCYRNNEWLWGYRENEAMGGDDPYSASKGASELISNSYFKSFFEQTYNQSIASVRVGNVIGGGDWAENRIVPDYFRAVENNRTLKLRYPNATRPWQHVLEPLGGYLLLGSKLFTEGKKFSGGWNFGPLESNSYTVEQLINEMKTIYGKGEYICDTSNEKKHEASLLKLDISKAVSLLEWTPVLNFNETVQFTVEGYKAEYGNGTIYNHRVKQIRDYLITALQKNIKWAQ